MLLPQILSFFKFYPYCGSSKTEVLCTYFRQRKVPYQKKNRPFSSDVFCQKVRTVSTVATGFIRYWICILKFFLHNVKNLKLLLAFSYTFMHKEITFYIYRSICRLDGVIKMTQWILTYHKLRQNFIMNAKDIARMCTLAN